MLDCADLDGRLKRLVSLERGMQCMCHNALRTIVIMHPALYIMIKAKPDVDQV